VSWYAWAPWVKDELHANLSSSAHILGIATNSRNSSAIAAFGATFSASMPLFLFPHDLVLSELWALIQHPSYWMMPWSWHQYLERAVGKIENVALGKFGLSGIRLSGLWGTAHRGWPSAEFRGPTGLLGWSLRAVDGYGTSVRTPLLDTVTFVQQLHWIRGKMQRASEATLDGLTIETQRKELKCFAEQYVPSSIAFNETLWKIMLRATSDLDAVQETFEDGQGSSAVSTVFTLYIRLHLKRQLHYLRIGMLALFVLAGDVEDGVATLLWPLLCWLMYICPLGTRYNRRELEESADGTGTSRSSAKQECQNNSEGLREGLWIASPVAFLVVVMLAALLALSLTLIVSVFLPDLLAELLRVGVMFDVASMASHSVTPYTGEAVAHLEQVAVGNLGEIN
jgi:hypothetical protein